VNLYSNIEEIVLGSKTRKIDENVGYEVRLG
jgi:hypothetical protein